MVLSAKNTKSGDIPLSFVKFKVQGVLSITGFIRVNIINISYGVARQISKLIHLDSK